MSKPRIAIIGANEAIDILIHKAKEKGYETHVFAWECGDPGEKTADVFYPISVADKEKILEICKNLGLSGVCSITSDFAVGTVNYVSRNLGLVCNSEKTDAVARDKYLMRCAFRDAGLYTPWFTKVDKNTQLSFMKDRDYPVIVKPTDRWSSKGVTRVNEHSELQKAVKYATTESLSGEAIIEGFMDGPEYSAECICQDGVCHILAITEKMTTGYPHYVESGHVEPANIRDSIRPYLDGRIRKAVASLDITNSAAHVEFRILENQEIGFIEIGARMGGDYIGTDLVRLSTGHDYVSMVIDVACGIHISFRTVPHYNKAMVRFLLSKDDLDEYTRLRDLSNEYIIRASTTVQNFDHDVLNSSDRYGYYIFAE